MSNIINNMDDLCDDNIGNSLRRLGYAFPKTASDFRRIDSEVKNNNSTPPGRLKDPFNFLGKRCFKKDIHIEGDKKVFIQNLSQAAREGNDISDEIKRKMAEDKQNSRK